MLSGRLSLSLGLFLSFGFLITFPILAAAENTPAQLLPGTTVFFAEISNPPAILDGLLEHPRVKSLQQEEAYQAIMQDPKAIEFLLVLDYVEAQLGMKWDEALKALTSGGITVAFDAHSEGAALFIKAKDEQSLGKIVQTVLKLARQDAADNHRDVPYEVDEYRGITTYGVKNGGFATYENWFLFATNENIGRVLLDGVLDENPHDSLAMNKQFQQAISQKKEAGAAWLYVDLKTIREAGTAKSLFSGKTDNPLMEILVGGILEILKETPYLTASLSGTDWSAQLRLSMPYQKNWVSVAREHYFGLRGAGQARKIPEIPHLLFAISAYRNFSDLWQQADELFDEQMSDQVAAADDVLTKLFSGKSFGEDILGAFFPEILFLVTRQDFSEDRLVPAIQVPAFAVVVEMKKPKTTPRDLRRVFQSLIGFFNIMGVQNGQPQLELNLEKNEHGELISATFIPDAGGEKNQPVSIHFNFSPTIAFFDNHMIVASTTELARDLASISLSEENTTNRSVNVSAVFSASVLKSVLEDNRSHLISLNRIEKSHSQEEAKNEIGILLKLLGYFQRTSLSLATTDDSLSLELTMEVAK